MYLIVFDNENLYSHAVLANSGRVVITNTTNPKFNVLAALDRQLLLNAVERYLISIT